MSSLRNVVCAVFIDTVVGEMHATVVQLLAGSDVAHGRKTGQTILKQVDPQRVVRHDSDVKT